MVRFHTKQSHSPQPGDCCRSLLNNQALQAAARMPKFTRAPNRIELRIVNGSSCMNESPNEPPARHAPARRWRMIPAAVLTLFGAMLLILSILNFLLAVLGFRPFGVQNSTPPHFMLGTFIMAVASGGATYAGRLWWSQKWRSAIVCTVICYLLGVCAASLAFPDLK